MILRRTDKTMEKLTLIFKKSFGHKLTLACLGVSILALLPFPYSFYVLIRLIFFVALLWCGWQLYLKDNRIGNLHFIIGGLAILFNPFFMVHLGSKGLWFVINLAVVYFIYTIADRLHDDGGE